MRATRSSVLTHLFERAHIFCRLTLCWARTTAPVHGSRWRVHGGVFAPERRPHSRLENLPLLVQHQCLSFFLRRQFLRTCILYIHYIFICSKPGGLWPNSNSHPMFRFFLCVSLSLFSFAATLDDFWRQLTAGRLMCRIKFFARFFFFFWLSLKKKVSS